MKRPSRAERAATLDSFILTDADRPAGPAWLTNNIQTEEPMTTNRPTNYDALINHFAGLALRPTFADDRLLTDCGAVDPWIAALLSAAGKTRAELLAAVEAEAARRLAN